MTKEQIQIYLTDTILNKIVGYIMQDKGCDMHTAMQELYSSPVMSWLQNAETELYVQSPAYVYELMKRNVNA